MTQYEADMVQKAMNWLTTTHLVSNIEQLSILEKERREIVVKLREINKFLYEWFDNTSAGIVQFYNKEL